MKIIDCFTFNVEFDLLEFRINAYQHIMDYFIVCESDYTHSGLRKKRYAESFILKLLSEGKISTEVANKIIYLNADLSKYSDAWARERAQRDWILRFAETNFDSDDILLVSDCDEFPSPVTIKTAVHYLAQMPEKIYFYTTTLSLFRINYINKYGPEAEWRGPYVIKNKAKYSSLTEIRNKAYKLDRSALTAGQRVAGWHLSYIGDEEFLKRKRLDTAHQEQAVQEAETDIHLMLEQMRGPYDKSRGLNSWACVPLEYMNFPQEWLNYSFIKKNTCNNRQSLQAISRLNDIREKVREKKSLKDRIKKKLHLI